MAFHVSGSIDWMKISIPFYQIEKCSPSNKGGRLKDASSLKMICFRPIFCNLQHVALIPIENYDDTHEPREGVNWFLNKNTLLKPE